MRFFFLLTFGFSRNSLRDLFLIFDYNSSRYGKIQRLFEVSNKLELYMFSVSNKYKLLKNTFTQSCHFQAHAHNLRYPTPIAQLHGVLSVALDLTKQVPLDV